MGGSGFLQGLMTFPKDTINEETVELMQPYLTMEDYTLESAKKVGTPCAYHMAITCTLHGYYMQVT